MKTATRAAAQPTKGQRAWQLGVEHANRADWTGAARAFADAVSEAPRDALYWINLANARRHAGDYAGAADAAERALKLDAKQPLALRVLGEVCAAQHRYADAVAAYERLEATGCKEPDAMLQHGANLLALRRPMDAVNVLVRGAAEDPTMVALHAMMATAFRDLALKKEAIECLRTVLALDPGNLQAMAHLSYEKRHVCEWGDLDQDVQALTQTLATAPAGLARVASVFSLLSLPIDPALHLAAAKGEARAAALGAGLLPALRPEDFAGRRIRLGFISYDFHEHPVSQLLVEVLEAIDRSRFEVLLYSTGPDDGSAIRKRLMAASDSFVELRGLSDAEAGARMRADGIELMLDLQGFTLGQRMGILASRPAPLQVEFLGYPGSTGATYIDYLIGDPLVTPLELAGHYSEKLAQMPLTFQPNGRLRPLPSATEGMTRERAGLPEGAFVMCAFNHTYKILPAAFDVWCDVMRELPHAVLWLKETSGQLHDNVRAEAEARGVSGSRIIFARATSWAEHFARLAMADVFVDTWPYNAHTTAADALWSGVPVVTLYGNSFASRVASSVLNAAGVGELAFSSVDDYRCAILALALDPALLAQYRERLQTERMTLPLFDTQRYTRELESLLERMVARWRAGLLPEHLPAAA